MKSSDSSFDSGPGLGPDLGDQRMPPRVELDSLHPQQQFLGRGGVYSLFASVVESYPQLEAMVWMGKNGQLLRQNFAQMQKQVLQLERGLIANGVVRGEKVLFLAKPVPLYHACILALLKLGAVCVFIDPGMGKRAMLKCIAEARPDYLVGSLKGHLFYRLYPDSFSQVKKFIWSQALKGISKLSFEQLLQQGRREGAGPGQGPDPSLEVKNDALAVMVYTSGATGPAKGVLYGQGNFMAQIELLKSGLGLGPGDRDLPGLPLFSLLALCMGMTTCIPPIDPANPSGVVGRKLYQFIEAYQPTFLAGSPAIWKVLGQYCRKQQLQLPSVKILAMFGAPIPPSMHQLFRPLLPQGTTATPYGATECLPVSNIYGRELLQLKPHHHPWGICVGRPLPGVEVKIVPEGQRPSQGEFCPALNPSSQGVENFPIGEIWVTGAMVTRQYFQRPKQTQQAKDWYGTPARLWHNMGDMGYLDDCGRLWFCGRRDHRVWDPVAQRSVDSVPFEQVFSELPGALKVALIALEQGPGLVICVEKKLLQGFQHKFSKESVLARARQHSHSCNTVDVFLTDHFPTDPRHHIKINRKRLGLKARRGDLVKLI